MQIMTTLVSKDVGAHAGYSPTPNVMALLWKGCIVRNHPNINLQHLIYDRITTLIQPHSPIFTKLFLFSVRIWPIIAQGFNNLARVFWRVGVHSFADICMSLALQTCKLERLPLSRCSNLPHTVSLCRAL